MSLERLKKILACFGFTQTETEVYVYLAKTGRQRGKDITSGLRMKKQQLYPALKRLKQKGIVTSMPQKAEYYSALAFEELLNRYLRLGAKQAEDIMIKKQELIENWQEITQKNNDQKQ